MERISISWPAARTTSPAALPIRARATGETYEIDPFRGSASSSPTILNACRLPSSRLNITRCPKATAPNSAGGGTSSAVLRRSANYLRRERRPRQRGDVRRRPRSAARRHRQRDFRSSLWSAPPVPTQSPIWMRRDRAIRQLDLRGRFGAFFSGEGHAHCSDFPFPRRSLPRQAARGRALIQAWRPIRRIQGRR